MYFSQLWKLEVPGQGLAGRCGSWWGLCCLVDVAFSSCTCSLETESQFWSLPLVRTQSHHGSLILMTCSKPCCYCLVAKSCATPWAVAGQAPLSMGFSRQIYWTGLPFPSPGDLPDLLQGIFYGDTKRWWSLPQEMLLRSQAMIPCPLSCCWYVGSNHD